MAFIYAIFYYRESKFTKYIKNKSIYTITIETNIPFLVLQIILTSTLVRSLFSIIIVLAKYLLNQLFSKKLFFLVDLHHA